MCDSGEYIVSDNQINGRKYFVSADGEHAIWYSKDFNSWGIGTIDNLGENRAGISSSSIAFGG